MQRNIVFAILRQKTPKIKQRSKSILFLTEYQKIYAETESMKPIISDKKTKKLIFGKIFLDKSVFRQYTYSYKQKRITAR